MPDRCVRVKICGICDLETAKTAVNEGADALGFVFAPSKRKISPESAREIIKKIPPFVSTVGVFVNQTIREITDIVYFTGLDTVQLHGDETPELCRSLKQRVIKSFPVTENSDLDLAEGYDVDAYLLDAKVSGSFGGTGATFDWQLAANFKMAPLILAGGLTPVNVREAIDMVRPYAVDVSSGVESGGRKDREKIKEFIRRVKG
jgi:phosphoribosylanthranilate isomerase